MVKYEVCLLVIFALALVPAAQAFQPAYSCTDANTLQAVLELNDSGTITRISQDAIPCPYGCYPNAGRYGSDCANPPYSLPLTFYLLIFAGATAFLVYGVFVQRWLLCMVATVFFLYLAFQAFLIGINDQLYMIVPMIMISALAGIVSLVATLHGVIEAYRKAREEPAVKEGEIPNSDRALRPVG